MADRRVICEQWNGMERRGSNWCKTQAEALKNRVKEDWDDIDGVGLIELLYDMANVNFTQAVNTAESMMEYMVCIVISPDNDRQRYWNYKVELLSSIFECAMGVTSVNKEGELPLRKDVEKYWNEIYSDAVGKVVNRAKYAKEYPFYTELIPKESPWTLEDFLEKSDYELIDMLVATVKQSEQ